MSVLESDKIDGVAVSVEDKVLNLLITDHLDFKDEYKHLLTLQEKINAYLGFIEAEQYREIYPDSEIESFIIEIHFKHKITDNCRKFIKTVNNQIGEINTICIIVEN